jgi:hypothetical protein
VVPDPTLSNPRRELAEEIGFVEEDAEKFSKLVGLTVVAPRLGDIRLTEDTHAWGQVPLFLSLGLSIGLADRKSPDEEEISTHTSLPSLWKKSEKVSFLCLRPPSLPQGACS